MTLHILTRNQLVRFRINVQPRNIGTEQLVIIQLLPNPRNDVLGSSDKECQEYQAEHYVQDRRAEIVRQRGFGHGESQGLDGSLMGRCAWAAVEDDGVESLAANVLG